MKILLMRPKSNIKKIIPIGLLYIAGYLRKTISDVDIKAFFITDAMGLAGDLDNIQKICKKRGVLLIEDNCEALGTELCTGKTGTFGLVASFSFFVAHHLSIIEGGMVCTNDCRQYPTPALLQKICFKILRLKWREQNSQLWLLLWELSRTKRDRYSNT